MENNNKLKKVNIKDRACYYFDDIIKIKNFDNGNVLLDENLYENILIYHISQKALIGANHCVLGSIKQMGLLNFMMGLDIQYYLGLKNMISFTLQSDSL